MANRPLDAEASFGFSPPFALQVEITSSCNLACKVCPLTSGDTASQIDAGHMSELVWSEVVAVAQRAQQVFVSGFGEPLKNPRCLGMLEELGQLGVKTTFVTNGVGISEVIAARLAAVPGLAHINVSIDSPDPAIYRSIRGGSLPRAWRGLERLARAFEDPRRISVSSVAMRSNLASLAAFPALLAELGISHYIVQGIFDYNEASQNERLLHQVAAEQFALLRSACTSHGVELTLTTPERSEADVNDPEGAIRRFYGEVPPSPGETRQCMLPWEIPYIDKDGRVFSCCFAASSGDLSLGRIGPDSLEDVWTGAQYVKFRSDLLDSDTTPDICRRCTAVPLGVHPLTEYGAVFVGSQVSPGEDALVVVRMRNTGRRNWSPDDPIKIGTIGPRDGASPLHHRSWLEHNRPATITESAVAPGGEATFRFRINRAPSIRQEFQLVVDGLCWIPETAFEIRT